MFKKIHRLYIRCTIPIKYLLNAKNIRKINSLLNVYSNNNWRGAQMRKKDEVTLLPRMLCTISRVRANRRYARSGLNSIKLIAGRRFSPPWLQASTLRKKGVQWKRRSAREMFRTGSPLCKDSARQCAQVNFRVFFHPAWYSCGIPDIPICIHLFLLRM